MNTVRVLDGYYEATGPHAVNRSRAEYVLNTAFGILARHAGHIALNPIRGVRLPLEDGQPIDYDKLRIGTGKHVALFTDRPLDASKTGLPLPRSAIRSGVGGIEAKGSELRTKLIITDRAPQLDPIAMIPIYTGVHEGAHTFGLGHCKDSSCIMQPTLVEAIARNILTIQDPFCKPCAEFLESGFDAKTARRLDGVIPLD